MVSTRSSGGVNDAKSFSPHERPPRSALSSSKGSSFEDRKYHRIAQDYRDTLMETVTLVLGDDDQSAEVKICDALSATNPIELTVTSTAPLENYYTLPSCLTSSNLTKFIATAVILPDWSFLPTTLQSFTLSRARFVPSSPSSYGYHASGSLDWDAIWSRLVSLHTLVVDRSSLTSLPDSLPGIFVKFAVSLNSEPLGEVPPNLFANFVAGWPPMSSLSVEISNCRLSGTIPPALLEPLRGVPMQSFELSLTSNALTNSIPPSFLEPLGSPAGGSYLTNLDIRLGDNALTGSIVSEFLPVGLMAPGPLSRLSINIDKNLLSGSVPSLLFGSISSVNSIAFSAYQNRFNGYLPSQLFNNDTWTGEGNLVLTLASNSLSGNIPTNLISSSFSDRPDFTMGSVSVDLSNNPIGGFLPSNFFSRELSNRRDSASYRTSQLRHSENVEFSRAATAFVPVEFGGLDIIFENMSLSGTVPSDFFAGAAASEGRLSLYCAYNQLTGQFPDIASTLPRTSTLTIDMSHNQLFGNPPTSCNGMSFLTYTFSHNNLNGSIPSGTLSDCQSLSLDVGDNPQLSGEIPAEFFKIPTMRLAAPRTNLTGTVPVNMTSSFGSIDFAGTLIDFCESPIVHPKFNFTTINCVLDDTNAACVCPEAYPSCSRRCIPVPVVAPTLPPVAPTTCTLSTRPSVEFVCVNGVWTAPFTSTPILTIPSGAGTVVVDGNVTSTSIVFNGVGSAIVIRGCAANLTMVTVELTQEQLKQLGSSKTLQPLLTFSNASDCGSLEGIALDTIVSSGCRKVKTEKVVSSDGNTFGAYFTMNASGCNTWWIILVSVICGVVILGVVAAVVTGVLWKQHQEKKEFGRLSAAGSTSART